MKQHAMMYMMYVQDDGCSSDMCKMVVCKEKEETFTTPPYAWCQMTGEWHAINEE